MARRVKWRVLHALTVAAWAVLIYAAVPYGWPVSIEIGRIAQLVAGVGMLAEVRRWSSPSAVEVFLAGQRAGRETSGLPRPHLRSVD